VLIVIRADSIVLSFSFEIFELPRLIMVSVYSQTQQTNTYFDQLTIAHSFIMTPIMKCVIV